MTLLSAFLLLGLAGNVPPDEGINEAEAVDICSFFEDPSRFTDQEATITGRYVRTAHGYFLNPEGCPEQYLMVLLTEGADSELERIVYSQHPPSRTFDDVVVLTGTLTMALYHDWGGIPPRERPSIYVLSFASKSDGQ